MTTKQVASLVDEAIALDRQIADLEAELTSKKQALVAEAQSLLSAECGVRSAEELTGCTYTFHGEDAGVCTVSFPKDKLISGFFFQKAGDEEKAFRMKDGKLLEIGPIRQLASEAFAKLFSKQYKPAKSFRELCSALLPKATAAKLLALCEEPSSPRVSFETKESV